MPGFMKPSSSSLNSFLSELECPESTSNALPFNQLYTIFKSLCLANLVDPYDQRNFDNWLNECGRYRSPDHNENGLPVTLGWFPDGTRCQIMIGGGSQEHFWHHKKVPKEGSRSIRAVHLLSAIRNKEKKEKKDKSEKKVRFAATPDSTKEKRKYSDSYEDLNLILARLGPIYTAPYEAFYDVQSHSIWLLSEFNTVKFVHFGRFDKKAHGKRSIAAVKILDNLSLVDDRLQEDCVLPSKRVIVGTKKDQVDSKDGLRRIKAKVLYARKRIDYKIQGQI